MAVFQYVMAVCHTAAAIVSRLADRADVWQTPIIGVNSMGYANTEKRLAAYRVLLRMRYPRSGFLILLIEGNSGVARQFACTWARRARFGHESFALPKASATAAICRSYDRNGRDDR